MKHVVVDFEMNPVNRKYIEERKTCKMEIIQIGAVILDENYKEIGSYSTLVKPEYNQEIEYAYQKLTGISTYMVKNAPVFIVALDSFFSWIKSYKEEVDILAWSENDLNQLLDESELKEYVFDSFEENLINIWQDFQAEFDEKMNLEYKCSLVEAMILTDQVFEGKQHDALVDAHNTGNLLAYVRDEKRISHSYRQVMEQQETTCCTLGDLFDFSVFDFS